MKKRSKDSARKFDASKQRSHARPSFSLSMRSGTNGPETINERHEAGANLLRDSENAIATLKHDRAQLRVWVGLAAAYYR